MSDRFYIDGGLLDSTCLLEGSEAHHLIHVMRGKLGDRVELFNGRGAFAQAEISELARKSVQLRILDRQEDDDDAESRIVLATAVPKGDRFRWLVEKATELGVSRLIPLKTETSVVEPRTSKLDKMQQTVIAACKQCGRNRLMAIDEPLDWRELFGQNSNTDIVVADPSGQDFSSLRLRDRPILIAIGPEGGLTNDELVVARDHDVQVVNLGQNILRIETAAIALSAAARLMSTHST